jgi:predicted dehydrogenase
VSETFAVIGLGSIAGRHRKNVRAVFPGAKIVAMSSSGRAVHGTIEDADVIASNLDDVAALKPKWAVVASPASAHAEHAIHLLEEGVAVLIEKPMVVNEHDSALLQAAIDRGAPPVAVAHCLRYMPAASVVKAALEEGCIGTIYNVYASVGQYLPSWRPGIHFRNSVSAQPTLGGGVLLELSHEFDYLQWILGELDVEFCLLRNSRELDLEVEEIADVTLTAIKSGVVCQVHLDFLQIPPQRTCQFIGSHGRLDWNLIDNSVTVRKPDSEAVLFADGGWDKNNMYINMLKDFDNLVCGKPNRCVPAAEAGCTVRTIVAAKRKAVWGSKI